MQLSQINKLIKDLFESGTPKDITVFLSTESFVFSALTGTNFYINETDRSLRMTTQDNETKKNTSFYFDIDKIESIVVMDCNDIDKIESIEVMD